MARKKKIPLKHFSEFIEGDDELRRELFEIKPAAQQVIFQLYSDLDHVQYGFFLHFCGIPSTSFWDLILAQLSAVASGASKNRNFCENIWMLEDANEEPSDYAINRPKIVSTIASAHSLWFELTSPTYTEQPNTTEIWKCFWDLNPVRTVWEWWFDARCKEVKKLWDEHSSNLLSDPHAEIIFEQWASEALGLHRPKTHWYQLVQFMLETYDQSVKLKHKISKPYLRLVYTVTKRIAAYNQPSQFFDTVNIGCSGLMRAISKYSPSISLAFPTFAEREIRYEIYYQLSNYNLVVLPHQTWQRYREYETLKKDFIKATGRDPTLNELAIHFGLNKDEVIEVYSQIALQSPVSLDQRLYDDDVSHAATLKDRIEDPQEKELRQLYEDNEVLLLTLSRMPFRERKIFAMFNNLCDVVQDLPPDRAELDQFFVYGMVS